MQENFKLKYSKIKVMLIAISLTIYKAHLLSVPALSKLVVIVNLELFHGNWRLDISQEWDSSPSHTHIYTWAIYFIHQLPCFWEVWGNHSIQRKPIYTWNKHAQKFCTNSYPRSGLNQRPCFGEAALLPAPWPCRCREFVDADLYFN